MGGILEMANHRLYPFWARLTEGLRTGRPQNELASNGESLFVRLYADPARLKEFLRAMTGVSRGANLAIAATLLATPARADLVSPGELSRAHEKLEGLQNCTKCHLAGKQFCSLAHFQLCLGSESIEGFGLALCAVVVG